SRPPTPTRFPYTPLFRSYQLAVVSLKLTRADGTAVETLPAPSKVEFAQLANLSEVISARQVSTGTYTGVSMTLDYSGATIVVDRSEEHTSELQSPDHLVC